MNRKSQTLQKLIMYVVFVIIFITAQAAASNERYFREEELQDFFGGPREGGKALKFTLETLDGESVTIPDDVDGQPIVLEFGSYTCPIFRGKHDSMERLYAKYGDEAKFFLIYTIEAHPDDNACPYRSGKWVTEPNIRSGILYKQPRTKEERIEIAHDTRSALDITMPMLVDDMDNAVWNAYGRAPNAAYLIGTDRKIKLRQGWFEPSQFERALKDELGN